MLTWDGIVTKFHKQHVKQIGLNPSIEAYIQYITLKKSLESISYGYRRGCEDERQEESKRDLTRADEIASPTMVEVMDKVSV